MFAVACASAEKATPASSVSGSPVEIPTSVTSGAQSSVYLSEPTGEHQTGTAVITEVDGGIRVAVSVTPPEPSSQPAHIHEGTCDNVGNVVHTLENIVGGASDTFIPDVTLDGVATGDMVVNLHLSFSDFPTFTACGLIPVDLSAK